MPVVAVWCAILAGLGLSGAEVVQTTKNNPSRLDAAEHYELAVTASNDGDLALAADHLAQYCRTASQRLTSSDSYRHYWLSLFRLAELYVHTNQPERALQTLQLAVELELPAAQRDAGVAHVAQLFLSEFDGQQYPHLRRWVIVAESAAKQLDDNHLDIAALDEYCGAIADASMPILAELPGWREHSERMAYECGRRLEESGRFPEAIDCYRQLVVRSSLVATRDPKKALDGIESWQQAYVRSCLKFASQATDRSQRQLAAEELQRLLEQSWLVDRHRQAVTLAHVDLLSALGRRAEALKRLEAFDAAELHTWAATIEKTDRPTQQDQITVLGNVALRRSELLAATGRKSEALQIALASIEKIPDYPLVGELHYLAGRLLVSRAEFDRARWHLAASMDSPLATAESRARAQWMTGETYFLQRDYAQAIEAYRRIAPDGPDSEWSRRGILQEAKCHELQGEREEALAAYRTFVSRREGPNSISADIEFAQHRIEELTRTQPMSASRSSQRSASPPRR